MCSLLTTCGQESKRVSSPIVALPTGCPMSGEPYRQDALPDCVGLLLLPWLPRSPSACGLAAASYLQRV
jgi:hypothetical protein